MPKLHSLDWAEKRLMHVSLQVGSLVSVSHLCPQWVSSDSSQEKSPGTHLSSGLNFPQSDVES